MPKTTRPRTKTAVVTAPSTRSTQHSSTQPENDDCTRRRERKRNTDRIAQREHRKRQKQYVEELEARIDLMINSTGSGKNVALMKENASLREEVSTERNFVSCNVVVCC